MPQVKLSILIPITPERFETVQPLLSLLGYTIGLSNFMNHGTWIKRWVNEETCETELVIYNDNKEITLGEKREALYREANGLYSWQIDSDDSIAPDAIEKILAAIDATNPCCVTFRERCDMNGKIQTCNHSLKYDKWRDNWDGFDYVRTPFYKDIIKTEIARSVPFPYVRYNEDELWSAALKPHLSTESHIDEELYYYSYYPKESHEERYGLNK